MPSWTAEHIVAAELAQRLIATQFPLLAALPLEPFGAGWDNTAYLVGGEIVFRFPRRSMAVPLIATESTLLPAIAPLLPVPIPVPEYVGEPDTEYPWPFAGHRLLAGRTACSAALSGPGRTAMAASLGRFLAALHAVPSGYAREHGAPPDTIGRLDVERRLPLARTRLAALGASGAIANVDPLLTILDSTLGPTDTRDDAHSGAMCGGKAALAYQPREDTLVHGDLYARHLLVGDGDRLSGVIDWGDVHIGDPAIDLSIAHYLLPSSAHAAFREAYGPIHAQTWRVARLRALWHAVTVLDYALDVGDVDLVRETWTALGYIAGGGDSHWE